MDIPELVIPLRLDAAKAQAALAKFGAAGKKAGDDVEEGTKKGQKGVADLGETMLKFATGGAALQLVGKVVGTITEGLNDAAAHARELAKEFIALQKGMQALAAVTGEKNTTEFVVQQARMAEAANLTPEDYGKFRTAYQAKTSMYIGEGEGKKLSRADSDLLEITAAEFAKGKGVDEKVMADMIGGMLAQEKGPTTAKAMITKLGKVYSVLEAASTDPQNLMSGMTGLMAGGFSAESAAATLAQMPEIKPGEEATYAQRTIMDIAEQTRKGKLGEAQGVRAGMDPREQLRAVVTFLSGKMKEGATPEEQNKILLDQIAKITTQDIPMKTLEGLARKGPEAMKEWDKKVSEVSEDAVKTAIESDRSTSAGKRRKAESQLAVAKAISGAEEAEIDTLKIAAEAKLEKEKRFKEFGGEDFVRELAHNVPFAGVESRREQLIKQEAVAMSFEAAGKSRDEAPGMLTSRGALASDQIMKENLAEARRQTKLMEEEKARKDVTKPLETKPAATVPARH